MINNIQESYCSFEVSKLLKEKEFKVETKSCYTMYLKTKKSDNPSFRMKKGELTVDINYIINNATGDFSNENYYQCARPTHALAIEWIRVNFNIHIYSFPIYINKAIGLSELSGYCFYANRDYIDTEYKTPQEATEAAILYTLQNLIK